MYFQHVDADIKYNAPECLGDTEDQIDPSTIVVLSDDEIRKTIELFNESQANICALEEELHNKQREHRELEKVSERASISLNEFHKQQQDLFNEFVVLRKKYDELKVRRELLSLLFICCFTLFSCT